MHDFLWAYAEVIWDVALLLIGIAVGVGHGIRLIRRVPTVALETVHHHLRGALYVILALMVAVVGLSLAGMVRATARGMPLWLQLLHPFLKWGVLCATFAYLGAVTLVVVWHSRHPKRGRLVFAITTLSAAMVILRVQINRPIAGELGVWQAEDGVALQSSGSSCVPASMANILRQFGEDVGERELAVEMGTTAWGSTHGRVALSLWLRGYRCRVMSSGALPTLHLPAALSVDHPATGPESHMVALMAFDGKVAEVWDPLEGKVDFAPSELGAIWHGLALEVFR